MGFTKGAFTRAEAATLFGMLLVICSLFLIWARVTPPDTALVATIALYRSPQLELYLNGFQMHVWLPLTLCSSLCSATLLWKANRKTSFSLMTVQIPCALVCLVIAITRLALLPGSLVALCGGVLLVCGAIDRDNGVTPNET